MEVKLYNSLSSKKEVFKEINKGKVNIYYCGPTVYNHAHIGNFRPVVTFDLLKTVLSEIGYEVLLCRNYTDIDDKIIKKATSDNIPEKEVSEYYIEAFNKVCDKLHLTSFVDYTPKVTTSMDQIIDFISKLLQNNFAYRVGDDIYFDTSKVPNYGKLSKMKTDMLEEGARVNKNEKKKDPKDFVLWKLTDDSGIKFDAPFGRGRPGWHTECVCMINDVFKTKTIDIHGGGFDLKFPHHENEIAQSCALNHSDLANYWMHVGFVNVNGEKMSKSLGNDLAAKDFIENNDYRILKLLYFSSHYRSPVNVTEDLVNECKAKLNKYETTLNKISYQFQLNSKDLDTNKDSIDKELYTNFLESLADDLNVNNAFVYVDQLIKEGLQLARSREYNFDRANIIFNSLVKMFKLLGFEFNISSLTDEDIEDYQNFLKAREEKDFAKSDLFRDRLTKKGIL